MKQVLTSELILWVQQQASAGFNEQALLKSMREAGWDEALALEALAAHFGAPTGVDAQSSSADQPSVVSRGRVFAEQPGPMLDGAVRQIDVGDRLVDVLVHNQNPKVVVFGDLLSDEECQALIDAARPRMKRSRTVSNATGGEELNDARTSQGMFFERGESDVIARIERRIERLLNWPLENGEGLQILHYAPGAEYRPHYDYFDPVHPGSAAILQRGGQRLATLVMYLNEPVRGGGTTFPDVGLEVMPKRGHAVFFAYDKPHPSTRTLHGGAPVLEGEKWVATKWLREKEFV